MSEPTDDHKEDETKAETEECPQKGEEPKKETEKEKKYESHASQLDHSPMAVGDHITQQTEIINNIINNYQSGKSYEISYFSIETDSFPLLKEDIDAVEHLVVYPEDSLKEWVSFLKERRVFFLTGPADSGKFLITKNLCFRLMEYMQKEYAVHCVNPLSKKSNISLTRLISKKSLKEKIVIFKDVSAKKDQSLMDFLDSCASEQIVPVLKELDAFLLFTADTGTFDEYRFMNLKITQRIIFPLDAHLLDKGFDIKLRHFCSLSPERDLEKTAQFFANIKTETIHKLGTMSNVSRFIDQFLDNVLDGKKPLAEAIEEVIDIRRHLQHWFLKELGMNAKEFETWTFAFCLTMFNGINYIDFYEIHREITRLLLRVLDPFKTLNNFVFSLSESELLEKCKAEIVKYREKEWEWEPYTERIQFIDPRYQKELLKIIFNNNRKILLPIIPFLKKYIESHGDEQRRHPAISLARIGILAPKSITASIITEWTNIQDNGWENVGFFYEGVLNSEDKDYKKYCMDILKEMAFSGNIDKKWTAITAYKQIGLHDLEFAMNELRKIQEDAIDRFLKKREENVEKFIYSEIYDLDESNIVGNLQRIYNEIDDILTYIQYSIVALSASSIFEPISLDPIDILYELRKWSYKGNKNTRASIAVIFMGSFGILESLEKIKMVSPNEDEDEQNEKLRSNLLLYSLSGGEEPVKKMADFLRELYNKCFQAFEIKIRIELKKKFFEHIQDWAIASLSDPKVSNGVKKLIVRLYHLGDDEFKNTLWDSINEWQFQEKNVKHEEKLKSFITDIYKQIFNS
ncbi:MAG: hypothetical protein ACM3SY_11965 [Candidatus Omnitrophota bacterium]